MSTSSISRRADFYWKRVAKSRREWFQSTDADRLASFAAADAQCASSLFLSPSAVQTAGSVVVTMSLQCISTPSRRSARRGSEGLRRMRPLLSCLTSSPPLSARLVWPARVVALAPTCTFLFEVV